MSRPPAAMKSKGRPLDPYFHPDEYLFRRVPLSFWGDPTDRPGPEAVELPDMSVGRSKYGHAEWVRFDVANNRHYEEWGILAVKVADVPPQFWNLGIHEFTFIPCHEPLEDDYPHSEVRIYINKMHIQNNEDIPEDIHLKWRLALLHVMDAIIKPTQVVPVRQAPPVSHKLEKHTVVA